MRESIFREQSLEKVKSPDNLNEYIRIANPGVWTLLVAILFLLLGFCLWGIFGKMRTVVQVGAESSACTIVSPIPLPDGRFSAQIEVENLRPISFLLN